MRIAPVTIAATALVALAACSGDGGPNEPADLCPANSTVNEATRVELAAGQSRQLLDAASNQCVLLSGGAHYVISVANTNPGSGQFVTQNVGFQLVGASGGASASVAAVDGGAVPSAAALFGGSEGGLDLPSARGRAAHLRMLGLNESLIRGMPSPTTAWAAERARRRRLGVSLATSAPPLTVGAVSDVHIMNRDDPGGNLCSTVNFLSIGARTVYVGTRSIVLEDTLSPLAGQMDTAYARLAQEFDNTMFPILEQYFGNPLAMDADLDNNGRVVMVFSPAINNFGDIAGFVLNCDFFPRSEAGVSNEGEFFYALVPDSLGGGIRDWDRGIRATLIHEVKHVTSNAERFARNAPTLEERWLEEGTAVHSEEIWARTQFGNTWKGNAMYGTAANIGTPNANTLYCEVRPTRAGCIGKPFDMFGNYSLLYDYLAANETYTPLGPIDQDDFRFYGAAWNLVRWAADNYAVSEQTFFKGLTQANEKGIANLSARTGRPWPEMLSDWSLALATDDRTGVTPARSQLTIPSWNTRDIFAGMNRDFPQASNFPSAFPLAAHAITGGAFTETVAELRSGTFSIFELTGVSGSQILELRSEDGLNAAPPGLVMQILRIQ